MTNFVIDKLVGIFSSYVSYAFISFLYFQCFVSS